MSRLYSTIASEDTLRRVFQIDIVQPDIQLPRSSISRNQLAPVVRRMQSGERNLIDMRWGFPRPSAPRATPISNFRNAKSAKLRPWLGFRCLIPATSFCYHQDGYPRIPRWFAINESLPLFAFAEFWRPWTGSRKGETKEHLLFSFLTTEPNSVVREVCGRMMPVILSEHEWEQWLDADIQTALKLQRPWPSEWLRILEQGGELLGLSQLEQFCPPG
jgi:putative SOS response-associated peptidase YedK